MSGIVGIFNLDRAPVDQHLLRRMTDFMTFRGPDAQEIWAGGHVGFGHTLLKTTFEAEHEHQPFTLDGKVWIVADARVDAQRDLISKLESRGHEIVPGTTDVELILRAYQVWGEDCVEHLLGDFAFAIWDGPRERLFCARDHMGVKPFFYAHMGQAVIFSNTLDCIRQHPAVSNELNDLAIADFLLFDLNQDPATTSFADVQRIPPAHRAVWSATGRRISRYWNLPIDEPVYFSRDDDYTERFKELLNSAVDDRLRTDKIGVFMSGGLDSTTLAATASHRLRTQFAGSEVHAFTFVLDGTDETRHYASLVAESLGIPIHFREGITDGWDAEWHSTSVHTPEPVVNPMNLIADRNANTYISAHTRVCFYGEGPDNALYYEWPAHLAFLARKRRFGRILSDVGSYLVKHRRPPLLTALLRIPRDRRVARTYRRFFPEWINPDLESRFQLRRRWERQEAAGKEAHPVRPRGYRSFGTTLWQALFETLDSAHTAALFEVRHPFLDLRMLRFLLAVPAIPWCRSKYLLRSAMKGVLPESVRLLPKSILDRDPMLDLVQLAGLPPLAPAPQFGTFVNPLRVASAHSDGRGAFWINFRPRSLNYWLGNLHREPSQTSKLEKDDKHNESIAESAA